MPVPPACPLTVCRPQDRASPDHCSARVPPPPTQPHRRADRGHACRRPLHAQVEPAVPADGSIVETTSEDYGHARTLGVDHDWFKRAVFYEVLVRAFADSNRDGTGDLRGLTEKLDYLQWLGVDCLWLPPFYDSPLRDGGYDIRDFRTVLPEFGTVDDFVVLLDEAHKRGIRVITDLVMNHTCDHAPVVRGVAAQPGRPLRRLLRLVATTTRATPRRGSSSSTPRQSNWTYDPVRGQFFWHRFFSHQPDLNYDNPAVQEAMLDVLRFWLDLGIDGFRLDAVPYLFERDGTNCENLPETHAFLGAAARCMEDEYPGRVLLAEANQWPADVVEYFGDPEVGGDECHMAFHFPLMPRIFMAVRRENRFPISEILAQTPADPVGLPVGHLPAQPRRAHARDGQRRRARLHVRGVRQGPADEGQHRHPPPAGAAAGERPQPARAVHRPAAVAARLARPVLRRRDRHGRQHLGWATATACAARCSGRPDRNAGFSACDPGRLYLPIDHGPALRLPGGERRGAAELHHVAAALEPADDRDPQAAPAFGLGDYRELGGSNPTVLAYMRTHGRRHVVLCVNNMSRFPQPVELDLSAWQGGVPHELTGGVPFPPIGELPYLLTLPGHGFYWFSITPAAGPEAVRSVRPGWSDGVTPSVRAVTSGRRGVRTRRRR